MNKKALRKRQLELRRSFTADIKAEEEAICKVLDEYIEKNGYKRVLVYVSTEEELDTRALIGKLLKRGVEVYVPKVLGKEMDFYKISSFDDLEKGYMNILEPKKYCDTIDYTQEDKLLILTPGLMFDDKGNRLGYGGGFYDRYMSSCIEKNISYFSIGLCFSPLFCTDGVIPLELTDVRLHGLATKDGIILF